MKVFNAVCFAILMDHHREGIEQAHPSYIDEKMQIFENCDEESAMSLLDAQNQQRVRQWCSAWKYPNPEEAYVTQ